MISRSYCELTPDSSGQLNSFQAVSELTSEAVISFENMGNKQTLKDNKKGKKCSKNVSIIADKYQNGDQMCCQIFSNRFQRRIDSHR